jgi:DNA-directed RNA polymerase subunit RPC12/RpoP
MIEEKEYYCKHCQKKFNEEDVDKDELEDEYLCPICGEYVDEI